MRIFVAEDEFLVGVQLEGDLRAAGCSVIGPFGTLDSALRAAREAEPDLAILDVNLNGHMVYPLADEMLGRGIPVILVSGYDSADLPERFRKIPHLSKPYDPVVLMELMRNVAPARQG